MGRRARVDRTAEQKLEIVLEGMRSGNISEACRRYEIAAKLFYRWRDEALQGAATATKREKDRRIRQLECLLGRKALGIETTNTSWGSEVRRGSALVKYSVSEVHHNSLSKRD